MIQEGNHGQGKEGNRPVFQGTVIGASRAACHVIDGGGIEGKADGEYYRTGDKGWEEFADLADGQSHQDGHHTAYNLGAQYGADTIAFSNGLHTGHVSKGYAQDNGQASA